MYLLCIMAAWFAGTFFLPVFIWILSHSDFPHYDSFIHNDTSFFNICTDQIKTIKSVNCGKAIFTCVHRTDSYVPVLCFLYKKKKEDLTNILRNREIFCAIRIVTSRVWQDSENVLTWQWLGWPNSNLQVLVSRRNFMLNQIKLKLQLIPIPCKEKKT